MWGLVMLVVMGTTTPGVVTDECVESRDCLGVGWVWPLPECVAGACVCPAPTCPLYTDTSHHVSFCGPCGGLGAACNDSNECSRPWTCQDSICNCFTARFYQGICVNHHPVPTSLSSVALVLLLCFLLVAIKLLNSHKALRRLCRRGSGSDEVDEEDETSEVAHNPLSNTKTAAFTITNSSFMATSDDPDLEWALELSRLQHQASTEGGTLTTRGGGHSPPRGSLSSAFPPSPPSPQPGPSGWHDVRGAIAHDRRRTSLVSSRSSSISRSSTTSRSSTMSRSSISHSSTISRSSPLSSNTSSLFTSL